MAAWDRAVADRIAEGETAMALFCVTRDCEHDAILKLPDLSSKLVPIC